MTASPRVLAAAALFAGAPLLGAAPAPPLSANGTLVVQANLGGQPLNVGGQVVLYHKGALYRLDLVSLGIPGAS
ncbi:MAG: hypothetical protein JOZ24_13645, partial [Candidatus Eremiobacteraeota bacterium]|nr:hypothetical protein [Candidatus Eremiobacteraeota bacterium]